MLQIKSNPEQVKALGAKTPDILFTGSSTPSSMAASSSTESLNASLLNSRIYSVATSSKGNVSCSTEDLVFSAGSSDSGSNHESQSQILNNNLDGISACRFPSILDSTDLPTGDASLFKVDSISLPLESHQPRSYLIAAVQTAWGIVLQRYTLTDDVCFACLMPKGNDGDQVGTLTAMQPALLPCRIKFREDATFYEVIEMLQENTKGAMALDSDPSFYKLLPGHVNTVISFESSVVADEDRATANMGRDDDINVSSYSLLL